MCTGAMLAALGGGAITAGADLAAGEAAFEASKENAAQLRAAANEELKAGEFQARELRREGEAVRGAQRAGAAAGGIEVNTGTAADIQAETDVLSKEAAGTARRNALMRSFGLRRQADIARFQGRAALRTGRLRAAGSLLGASSDAGLFG